MNNEKLISIKVPSIALFSLLLEIQSRTASIPKSSRWKSIVDKLRTLLFEELSWPMIIGASKLLFL